MLRMLRRRRITCDDERCPLVADRVARSKKAFVLVLASISSMGISTF